jgi:hypothetical protein
MRVQYKQDDNITAALTLPVMAIRLGYTEI